MNPLVQAAREARKNAYAPYSNYQVGVALEDEHGRIHVGVNVENVSYGATICAERSAVTRMVTDGGRRVIALALCTKDGGTPCGICLQVLSEFCSLDTRIILATEAGQIREVTFAELMPAPFASEAVRHETG
ncbi:MAG TPA: cytidine deaminase [Fimbriimonas sp.]|nr:cytidine deaminase [Fimbriimonas sp.]